jgi:hypothetical protein
MDKELVDKVNLVCRSVTLTLIIVGGIYWMMWYQDAKEFQEALQDSPWSNVNSDDCDKMDADMGVFYCKTLQSRKETSLWLIGISLVPLTFAIILESIHKRQSLSAKGNEPIIQTEI